MLLNWSFVLATPLTPAEVTLAGSAVYPLDFPRG
jgi:hypothetical protein